MTLDVGFGGRPGVVVVHKPVGPTTFDMVRLFKRTFAHCNIKKIGHFGSLDPFAEGVVLIGFNGAMKLNGALQERFSKTYVATGIFGLATPTGDTDCPEGRMERVDAGRVQGMDRDGIESFFRDGFLGAYLQAPTAIRPPSTGANPSTTMRAGASAWTNPPSRGTSGPSACSRGTFPKSSLKRRCPRAPTSGALRGYGPGPRYSRSPLEAQTDGRRSLPYRRRRRSGGLGPRAPGRLCQGAGRIVRVFRLDFRSVICYKLG